MKKLFFILALMTTSSVFSYAQIDEQELRIEMDRMEEQMSQAFKLLDLTIQNGQLFEGMDSLMVKIIPDMEQPAEIYPNGDPYQMHHFMDQLMGMFSEENKAELDLFFKDFEQRLPSPEQLEEWKEEGGEEAPADSGQKQGNSSKKSKKKAKIYRM